MRLFDKGRSDVPYRDTKKISPNPKQEHYNSYSDYESGAQTPYSEYDRSGTRTPYTEYDDGTQTRYTEYDDGTQTRYTDYESGRKTPYSEYPSEYSYDSRDEGNTRYLPSNLMGNQAFCTPLNAAFERAAGEYSESESSSSSDGSTFDDFNCNPNVNTNCMTTLFNRNTDSNNVPGIIHCDKSGPSGGVKLNFNLPIPLQYMNHVSPSVMDSRGENDYDQAQAMPQAYKPLFKTRSEGSEEESNGPGNDRDRTSRHLRRRGEQNPPLPRRALPPVHEDQKQQNFELPISQIVIRHQESDLVSNLEGGRAGNFQKSIFAQRQKTDLMRDNTNFKGKDNRLEPVSRMNLAKEPISQKQVCSPRHGLERIVNKDGPSPRNTFKNGDFPTEIRITRGEEKHNLNERETVPSKSTSRFKQERPYSSQNFLESKQVSGKPYDQFHSKRITKHETEVSDSRFAAKKPDWLTGKKQQLNLVEEESPIDERQAPTAAAKSKAHVSAWKNSTNSIPDAISFGEAYPAQSDLTGDWGTVNPEKIETKEKGESNGMLEDELKGSNIRSMRTTRLKYYSKLTPDDEIIDKYSSTKKKLNTETRADELMGLEKVQLSTSGDELMGRSSNSDLKTTDNYTTMEDAPKVQTSNMPAEEDELMGFQAERETSRDDVPNMWEEDELMEPSANFNKETDNSNSANLDVADSVEKEPMGALLSMYTTEKLPKQYDAETEEEDELSEQDLPSISLEAISKKEKMDSQIDKAASLKESTNFPKGTKMPLHSALTATTAMETQSLDTPLVATPAFESCYGEFQSKRLVTTSVALPIVKEEDNAITIVSLTVFFIQVLTDVIVIFVAWAKHFSGMTSQLPNCGLQIGLMLPRLDDDELMQEQTLQSRPSNFYRLPSLSVNDPGMSVEEFVPDFPTLYDEHGSLRVWDVVLSDSAKGVSSPRKKSEILTTTWESEKIWTDKCNQYEEFGNWHS